MLDGEHIGDVASAVDDEVFVGGVVAGTVAEAEANHGEIEGGLIK